MGDVVEFKRNRTYEELQALQIECLDMMIQRGIYTLRDDGWLYDGHGNPRIRYPGPPR